jgi:hypothetical protein
MINENKVTTKWLSFLLGNLMMHIFVEILQVTWEDGYDFITVDCELFINSVPVTYWED